MSEEERLHDGTARGRFARATAGRGPSQTGFASWDMLSGMARLEAMNSHACSGDGSWILDPSAW